MPQPAPRLAADPIAEAHRQWVEHGWADAAIPAVNAINYYDSVISKMGAKNAGEFTRLYMVPGMEHCGGGAGPNAFGQGGTPNGDRFHSIDAALEASVDASLDAADASETPVDVTVTDATDGFARTFRLTR